MILNLINKGNIMSINFSRFNESAVKTLKRLAQNFPTATEISFHDVFPDSDDDSDKLAAHIGTLAFLRHEGFITHDVGSVSSFILTGKGLALFNENIKEHLDMQLNN